MSESKSVPRSEWTDAEEEFDKAVKMSESRDQLTRINGRMKLWQLEKEHGREEMNRMWERIK